MTGSSVNGSEHRSVSSSASRASNPRLPSAEPWPKDGWRVRTWIMFCGLLQVLLTEDLWMSLAMGLWTVAWLYTHAMTPTQQPAGLMMSKHA